MNSSKKSVLFVCTHNSARSQTAEGLLNHFQGGRYEAFSAGTEKTLVRPLAIKAMRQIGIDISKHESKTVDFFGEREFDFVITVCDNAREQCPFIPTRNQRLHWSFEDPAAATGTDAEKLAVFQKVRNQIKERIDNYFG
ncbi:MAG: arsenate reductase ArsC [bacterium]